MAPSIRNLFAWSCFLTVAGCGLLNFSISTNNSQGVAAGSGARPSAARSGLPPDEVAAATGRLTVVGNLNGFAAEDSLQLEKIEQAFAQASPSMLVHIVDTTPLEKGPLQYWLTHIVSPTGKQERQCPQLWKGNIPADHKKHSPLIKYGALLSALSSKLVAGTFAVADEPRAMCLVDKQVALDEHEDRKKLPPGTTGLIWNVTSPQYQGAGPAEVVFVTVDGGRYISRTSPMALGGAPVKDWPTEVQYPLILPTDIYVWREKNMIPSPDPYMAIAKAWSDCVKQRWEPFRAQIEANRVANITYSTRENRYAAIFRKGSIAVEQQCSPILHKGEAVLVKLMMQREQKRKQLLAQNRTHFANPK